MIELSMGFLSSRSLSFLLCIAFIANHSTQVYPSGTICLSIINEEEGWRPAIIIKDILMGIQELLDNPNPKSPAQSDAYNLLIQDGAKYRERVRQEAKKYTPSS